LCAQARNWSYERCGRIAWSHKDLREGVFVLKAPKAHSAESLRRGENNGEGRAFAESRRAGFNPQIGSPG
jgi:hypothetical protein